MRVGTICSYTYKLLSYDKGPKSCSIPFIIEHGQEAANPIRGFRILATEFIYTMLQRDAWSIGSANSTYLLEPGDAFTFSGDVVHGPERLLDEHAKFLSIIIYAN